MNTITIDEYREIMQFDSTTSIQIAENTQNISRLGLTTLMVLSIATNAFGTTPSINEKDINFTGIGKYSYTNLEISNISDNSYEIETFQNTENEDFFDFSIKPLYTKEFEIHVKSFKLERFMPKSF